MRRRLLLSSGALSSALYVASIDVLAAATHPDYHSHVSRMVSELFAAGSPTRPVLTAPMLAYNVLVFAFAIGVWTSAGRSRAKRFTAVALAAYGATSSVGWFLPMDVVGEGGGLSQRDTTHIAATAIQGIAIASALLVGAFSHGRRFRLYSLGTLAVALVFGAVSGVLAARGATSWIGAAERVNIYAWMLWVAVLAVAFLREESATTAESTENSQDAALAVDQPVLG